jgi:hypothetical protein
MPPLIAAWRPGLGPRLGQVAHDHFIDLGGRQSRALERDANGRGAKIRRGGGRTAEKLADRNARDGDGGRLAI